MSICGSSIFKIGGHTISAANFNIDISTQVLDFIHPVTLTRDEFMARTGMTPNFLQYLSLKECIKAGLMSLNMPIQNIEIN